MAPNPWRVIQRRAFDVTRRRYAADTTQADGLRVRGERTDTVVRAYLHGEPGSTQALGQEGQSVDATVHGYSLADWRVASIATGAPADVVVWEGEQYELTWIRPWPMGGGGGPRWVEWTADLVVRDDPPEEDPP